MASTETIDEENIAAKGGNRWTGMLVGVVLAAVAGAGGFYAVSSGMILGTNAPGMDAAPNPEVAADLPDVVFVPMEAITVSLGPGAQAEHLRFRSQLEVPSGQASSVETLMPRIVDVLNAYLRAVEPSTLQEPDILARLRAQMLRRIRLVVGEGRVNDLLIMEFILK